MYKTYDFHQFPQPTIFETGQHAFYKAYHPSDKLYWSYAPDKSMIIRANDLNPPKTNQTTQIIPLNPPKTRSNHPNNYPKPTKNQIKLTKDLTKPAKKRIKPPHDLTKPVKKWIKPVKRQSKTALAWPEACYEGRCHYFQHNNSFVSLLYNNYIRPAFKESQY